MPRVKKNKKSEKEKRINPVLPGGFRDYPPEDAILKARLVEKIKKTFEDFGFDPMETPAVEKTEILTGGEKEFSKIIFNVKGSKDLSASKAGKKPGISLRFDLTIPLARFLAENPEIPKPFKRYQIGNVWRGESPQAGRYREFMQADVDIVDSSLPEADSEIVMVIYQTFKNLGIQRFLININNRKILNGLPACAEFPEKKLWEVLRIIDKKDKIGIEGVLKELKKIVTKKSQDFIAEFLSLAGTTEEKIRKARTLCKGNTVAEEGIQELETLAKNLTAAGIDQRNWQIDFGTVRGLGYYTGPVFETFLTDIPEIGGIFQGGRYDNILVPFTGQKIPAVGASLGVDRLYAAFEKLGLLKKKKTTTKVLILNLAPRFKNEYTTLAQKLRTANINTSIYLGDDRAFQAQLAYALKKEIPYIVIYGEEEQKKNTVKIKNLQTREQKEIPKENILQYFNTQK